MEPTSLKNRCRNVVEQRIEQIIEKSSTNDAKTMLKIIKNALKFNEQIDRKIDRKSCGCLSKSALLASQTAKLATQKSMKNIRKS